MRQFACINLVIYIVLLVWSCENNSKEKTDKKEETTIDWKPAQNYYADHMKKASILLDSLGQLGIQDTLVKPLFFEIRTAFKKAEAYAGAISPANTHRVNGPALSIYNDDSGRIVDPIGLQKLEETIFSGENSEKEFKRDIFFIKGFFNKLQVT